MFFYLFLIPTIKERQRLSFFLVVIFLAVFGLIVLAEVLFVDNDGSRAAALYYGGGPGGGGYDQEEEQGGGGGAWETPRPIDGGETASLVKGFTKSPTTVCFHEYFLVPGLGLPLGARQRGPPGLLFLLRQRRLWPFSARAPRAKERAVPAAEEPGRDGVAHKEHLGRRPKRRRRRRRQVGAAAAAAPAAQDHIRTGCALQLFR